MHAWQNQSTNRLSVRLVVFRLSLPDTRAMRLLLCLFIFFLHCEDQSYACHAREFNSLSQHIPKSLSRLTPIWRKVVRRLLRDAGAGFRRSACIFIPDAGIYMYICMIPRSRNNIVSICSNSVILKAKPSTETRCRITPINHGRNRVANHKQGIKRI